MPKSKKLTPKELYWAKKNKEEQERAAYPPPGLVNHGNTCFMNSVLQGLFATDLLRQMVEYQPQDDNRSFVNLPPHRSPLLTNGRGPKDVQQEWCEGLPVGDTFIRILERAWMMRDKKDRASMSPKELLARLGKKYDQYLDFRQQDAHEFFIHLLDCMRMEELDIIKKRQPPPPKTTNRQRSNTVTPKIPAESNQLRLIPEEERLTSFVDMIWGGRFTSYLICTTCKHASHTYEDFDDLSLSIRHDESKERKRDRLRAFAYKFIANSGGSYYWHNALALPRAHSQPPSPPFSASKTGQKLGLELGDIPEMIRRRSFESTTTATATVSLRNDGVDGQNGAGSDGRGTTLDVERTKERILEEISSVANAFSPNGVAMESSTTMPDDMYDTLTISSTPTLSSAGPLAGGPPLRSTPTTPIVSPVTSGAWSKKVGDRISRRISLTMSKGVKLGDKMKATKDKTEKSDSDVGGVAAALEKLTGKSSAGMESHGNETKTLQQHGNPGFLSAASSTVKPEHTKSKRHSALSLHHRLRDRESRRKPKVPASDREALEAIYLTRILQDTVPAYPGPLQMLKASAAGSVTPVGSVSATGSGPGSGMQALIGQLPKLNMGGSSQSIEECLRTFTAVEALDGDNMFGCHTCWKIAHGKIPTRRPVSSDDSSDEEETKKTPLDKSPDPQANPRPPMLSESSRMNTSLSIMTASSAYSTASSISTISTISALNTNSTIEEERIKEPQPSSLTTASKFPETPTSVKGRTPSEDSSASSIGANSTDSNSLDINTDTPPSSASVASLKTLTICTSPESAGDQESETSPAAREIPTIAMTMSSPLPPEDLREGAGGQGINIPLPNGVLPSERDALRLPARNFRPGHSKDESGSEGSMTSASDDEHDETSNISDTSSASVGPPPGLNSPGSPRRSRTTIPRSKQVIYRRALKRYLIAIPPPILVIHLKRFQQVSKSSLTLFGNLKKLDDYVSFPEYLNIQPFLAPKKEDYGLGRGEMEGRVAEKGSRDEDRPCIYRLYAVVVHIGNMLGGHYIAYTALPSNEPIPQYSQDTEGERENTKTMENGKSQHAEKLPSQRQWCHISDTEVKLVTLEEVLKAKAYLCMYERVFDYRPEHHQAHSAY